VSEASAAAAFVHDQRALRVVFGNGGLAALADEADRLDMRRILVVGSRFAGRASEVLGERVLDVVSDPRPHVPVDQVHETLGRVRRARVSGVVAVGGGSAIGLAKAVALETGVPIIAAPSTYSGSEMTRVWGRTEGGRKQTGRDERVAPRTVVYDPALPAALPRETAAASVLNAVAHAAEALYAPDRSVLSDLAAAEAVRVLMTTLARSPEPARLLRGAYLAGTALDLTTMGLHHKLCHVLGGAYDLPHAQTHSIVLPHVLSYHLADPVLSARFGAAGAGDLPARVRRICSAYGVPTALRDVGMPEAALDEVAAAVVSAPFANPRPVDAEELRALLRRAWAGAPVDCGAVA
jgi:maleylacetate reductase